MTPGTCPSGALTPTLDGRPAHNAFDTTRRVRLLREMQYRIILRWDLHTVLLDQERMCCTSARSPSVNACSLQAVGFDARDVETRVHHFYNTEMADSAARVSPASIAQREMIWLARPVTDAFLHRKGMRGRTKQPTLGGLLNSWTQRATKE